MILVVWVCMEDVVCFWMWVGLNFVFKFIFRSFEEVVECFNGVKYWVVVLICLIEFWGFNFCVVLLVLMGFLMVYVVDVKGVVVICIFFRFGYEFCK